MAEAHSAVAFSFSITHDGYNINYNREVLNLVWDSGVRSWKKRLARFRVSDSQFKIICQITEIYLFNLDWHSEWRLSRTFTKSLDCNFRCNGTPYSRKESSI